MRNLRPKRVTTVTPRLPWWVSPALACLLFLVPTSTQGAPPGEKILKQVEVFRNHAGPLTGDWMIAGSDELALSVDADGVRVFSPEAQRILSASNAPALPHGESSAAPPVNAAEAALTGVVEADLSDLIACLLTCDKLSTELPQRLGATLDHELVSLRFDEDDALAYTVGAVSGPSTLALVVDREVYRPLAVFWSTSAGERVVVRATAYDENGWSLGGLRVERGSSTLSLTRAP